MGCFFDILLILAIAQRQAKPSDTNVYRAYFIALVGDSGGTFLVWFSDMSVIDSRFKMEGIKTSLFNG